MSRGVNCGSGGRGQTNNFTFSLKDLTDDNFEFNENDRKFSKRVENNVGKGEIARYEQFSPFPSLFLKDLYCRHVKTRACLGKVNGEKKSKSSSSCQQPPFAFFDKPYGKRLLKKKKKQRRECG